MSAALHFNCMRCRRPLHAMESMLSGYGPKCRPREEGFRLEELRNPMRFDVLLERREGFDASTNVPWSVVQHSPDGFEWGYAGSGPADLALNILNAFVPPGFDQMEPVKCHMGKASRTAITLYQEFKDMFLVPMPREGGTISADDIVRFIENNARKAGYLI